VTDTILRLDPSEDGPYYGMARVTAQDGRLSWEAWGVLAYLHSLPKDWRLSVADLVKRREGGRDRMYRIIRELRTAGYVLYHEHREGGRVVATEYLVRMRPVPEKAEPAPTSQDAASPQVTPLTGLPDTVQPHLTENTPDREHISSTDDTPPVDEPGPEDIRSLTGQGLDVHPLQQQARRKVAERLLNTYCAGLGHKPRGARSTKPFKDALVNLLEQGFPLDVLRTALDECGESPWELEATAHAVRGRQQRQQQAPDTSWWPTNQPDIDLATHQPDPEMAPRIAALLERGPRDDAP
jgi:hypothetical protein